MSLDDMLDNLKPEEVPTNVDLTDLATEPGGAWPKGWYPAEIIEGYLAGSFQFTTADTESKKGDSRNLRLCFKLKSGNAERSFFASYNYRTSDFTPQRIEAVKAARKEFAGQKGKWNGYEDLQRSSLALGQLGQVQKATGVSIQFHLETRGIIAALFIGAKPDVRLGIDDETGYNEVTGLAPTGTGGKAKVKSASK